MLRLMGECINETMQRFAIITALLMRLSPVSKAELEQQVVDIAQRLSVLNNISAPEFIDKKIQGILINDMKKQGYIVIDEEGKYQGAESLEQIKLLAVKLVDAAVLQSITS